MSVSICGVCEITLILARFTLGFPFLGKLSSSSALFGLNFKELRNFYTSHFPSKVSLLYVLMVGFEFFSQECPSVSFFFARLGVSLECFTGQHP